MSVTIPAGQWTPEERESFVLSVKLFHYWDTKQVPAFTWEVVDLPAFLAFHISEPDDVGATELKSTPLLVKTYKLRTCWSPELKQDLMAFGSLNAQEEVETIAFDSITNEMHMQLQERMAQHPGKQMKFYIHRLCITPTIYDPATFAPRKGIMLRWAYHTIEPTEKFIGHGNLIKHNFADHLYDQYGFVPYRWDSQSSEGVSRTTPPPQEMVDELMRQHELKMKIRAIKQSIGYTVHDEKETIL